MWILRLGPELGSRTLRITPGSTRTVGRGARADFTVQAPLVSRVHCRLAATDAGLIVTDLDSTNGTFVNDERISHATLHAGDRLRLGRLQILVSHETPKA